MLNRSRLAGRRADTLLMGLTTSGIFAETSLTLRIAFHGSPKWLRLLDEFGLRHRAMPWWPHHDAIRWNFILDNWIAGRFYARVQWSGCPPKKRIAQVQAFRRSEDREDHVHVNLRAK